MRASVLLPRLFLFCRGLFSFHFFHVAQDGTAEGVTLQAQPVKTKVTESGGWANVRFGASAMQGRRKYMEDTTRLVAPFRSEDVALFGIFDGHGGDFVSRHAADHMAAAIERELEQAKRVG